MICLEVWNVGKNNTNRKDLRVTGVTGDGSSADKFLLKTFSFPLKMYLLVTRDSGRPTFRGRGIHLSWRKN